MTDLPARLASALADRYRLERELGAGGMATVYLAADLKHDRKVAIKVLKPDLAAVLGGERFITEIKTTAALQHPHILPLFDSGSVHGPDKSGPYLFYVMPYVEGETLRSKLDRERQLGIDEAIRIAREVADALDYAHRHGVIHRDIKPENILLHDGRATVADFGIALAVSAAAGGRMTETGLSLGTPHYMSPEQATAEREITGRSDIYSLGCVLYEMLTGNPPHVGATAQQIIMKIVTESAAPVTTLRRSVPPHVAAALARALEKLPADRFGSAAEFTAALANPLFGSGHEAKVSGVRAAVGRLPRKRSILLGAAVLLTVGAAAGSGWVRRSAHRSVPEATRFDVAMGNSGGRVSLRLSPDGRRVMLSGEVGAPAAGILVRDLAATQVVRLPGADGARDAVFSTDGAWITFTLERRLVKVPSRGGPPVTLSDDASSGGAWVAGDRIIYTRAGDYGLSSVSASGGQSTVLTTPDADRGEWGHWALEPLPGGDVVLFTNYAAPIDKARIEALDVRSGTRTVIVENAVNPQYSPTGHLLYVRDGLVFAIAFDLRRLRTTGTEMPLLDDVFHDPTGGAGAFDVASDGTVAYVTASAWSTASRVVWVDRSGVERDALPEAGNFSEPRLSPNGRQVALTVRDRGFPTVGVFDLDRGILSMTERSPGAVFSPIWSGDGRSILVTWEVRAYEIYAVRIDGSSPPALVLESLHDKQPTSIAPAAGLLAYDEFTGRIYRLMLAPLDGSGAPRQLDSASVSTQAALTSDGRWIAYTASTSGRQEVFVRATDGTGPRVQVSVGGGNEPRWTRAGREIVFRQGDAMMAVTANPQAGEFSTPAVLFRGPWQRAALGNSHSYDVGPAGDRFLMTRAVELPGALPVAIMLYGARELLAALTP